MKKILFALLMISIAFTQNLHKYSTQEVLNMVLDEPNTLLDLHYYSAQEALNVALDETNTSLKATVAGLNITPDNQLVVGGLFVGDSTSMGTESLTETGFATHANWDVTNDWDDSGGNATFTWSANQTSTLTQTQANLNTAGVANQLYKFSYNCTVTTEFDGDGAVTITTSFANVATPLILEDGYQSVYFVSAAAPTDFVVSAVSGTDTEGTFSLDKLTLKQITDGDVYISDDVTIGGDLTVLGAFSSSVAMSDIEFAEIGTSTYDDLKDYMDRTYSSGFTGDVVIADNADGTVDVSGGYGFIRATNSETAELLAFDWSGNASLNTTDDALNYVYVDYNAGSPQLAYTTDLTSLNHHTNFIVGLVYQEAAEAHISLAGQRLTNFKHNLYLHAFEHDGLQRSSGMVTTESGNRGLDVTAGVTWWALERGTTGALDTDGADTFEAIYRDGGGGWTEVAGQSYIDNANYDDGSGTLATLTNNRYGVHWVYLTIDGELYIQYGQGDYTLAGAEAAERPATMDEMAIAIPIAKIVVQKSATNFTDLDTLFDSPRGSFATSDHGALGGLGDDDHTNYFALAQDETITGTPIFADQTTGFTLGDGSAGIDFVMGFDGETNDMNVTYMEDEDYFTFDGFAQLGAGGLTFPDQGTDINSLKLTMVSDNSTTPQTGEFFLAYGANPYFRMSPPNASGTATPTMDMRSDLITWFNGEAGVDYYFQFNGETNDGTITYMEDEDAFSFDNKVGIGINAPDGTTHIHTGSAGAVTADGSADDLVVENSGAGGASILVPDNGNAKLAFGSPSIPFGAGAIWNHNADTFYLSTVKAGASILLQSGNATTALTIDGNQDIGIGTSPVTGSQLTLPQENDAVTPTLSIGGEGFYSPSADALNASIGGTVMLELIEDTADTMNVNADVSTFSGDVEVTGDASVKRYVYDGTPDADHAGRGIITEFTNGDAGNHNIGDVVYMVSDGDVQFADADAAATMPAFAIALETNAAASAGNYLTYGYVRDDTWTWTIGGIIYVSTTGTTGNTLTQTAPSGSGDQVQVVGVAITADVMLFNPSYVLVEI